MEGIGKSQSRITSKLNKRISHIEKLLKHTEKTSGSGNEENKNSGYKVDNTTSNIEKSKSRSHSYEFNAELIKHMSE